MRRVLSWLKWNPAVRKATMALVLVGATVVAFYWGRLGGSAQVDAQQIQPRTGAQAPVSQPLSDYSRRVVAYIHENVPITREELGEYLIARFGQERVEFLINRRIVEMACQAKGIYVTDAEVEAQLKDELKDLGNLPLQEFVKQVLKPWNKTLYEWKEDVIRPKLLLAKLCRPAIVVTQEDLAKAFEARYGPKVQCRMIAFEKGANQKFMTDTWVKVSQSEEEFTKFAKMQFLPNLAAKGGEIPPIHKHFGDAKVEQAAFDLKPGQVTQLLEMPDGTHIILKCDKHLAKDMTKTFEAVRLDLHKEMTEIKLAQKIQEHFAELRKQANPRVLIATQVRQQDLEREAVRNITAPPNGSAPRQTTPSGN